MSTAREAAWFDAGASFIIHSSDIIATRDQLTREIGALRNKMGDDKKAGSGDSAIV
jgi:hypothetical protein